MTLEILSTTGKPYDLNFEGKQIKVQYGTLAIDSHSILNGRFYSDMNWLHTLKSGIEKYFPQFCNMTSAQVMAHPDLLVFKSYILHQIKLYHLPSHRTSNEPFDWSYNPSHYYNYSIPQEAIAS